VVDAVVLSAFRRGHLTPAQAQAREGGVYLNEEGRRRLIELLEGRFLEEVAHPLGFRKPLGEMIELQAHRLKKAILGKEAYTPYYLRIH
jgi:CRISPR-associated protein Cas1